MTRLAPMSCSSASSNARAVVGASKLEKTVSAASNLGKRRRATLNLAPLALPSATEEEQLQPVRKHRRRDDKLHKVRDRLYVSSARGMMNHEAVRECRITTIVNVTRDIPNLYESTVSYLNVSMADDPHSDDLSKHFTSVSAFITDTLADPAQSVLVHCQNGISRAPALIIAHLIQSEKISFDEAFASVKAVRDRIYPNAGFCTQLKTLSEIVLGMPRRRGRGPGRQAFHHDASEGEVGVASEPSRREFVHPSPSQCREHSVFVSVPVSEVCS